MKFFLKLILAETRVRPAHAESENVLNPCNMFVTHNRSILNLEMAIQRITFDNLFRHDYISNDHRPYLHLSDIIVVLQSRNVLRKLIVRWIPIWQRPCESCRGVLASFQRHTGWLCRH